MKTKTYVIIPDTQMPFEDRKALNAVINFIGELQPDEVVHIGDVVDFPQPSRWNKGTKGEFETSVFRDAEYTIRNLIKPLRNVYSGDIGFLEGNHDLRPRDYLSKYAPALAESHAFDMDVLLEYDTYEIRKLPDYYEFAPEWVMMHGHLGKGSISNIAGNTAANRARNMHTNVIMGHTHRLGSISYSSGYDGRIKKTFTGVEVGNLMDMRRAGYLKKGTANWQQGFCVVYVDGKYVNPVTVPISGRKFIVDGKTYQY